MNVSEKRELPCSCHESNLRSSRP